MTRPATATHRQFYLVHVHYLLPRREAFVTAVAKAGSGSRSRRGPGDSCSDVIIRVARGEGASAVTLTVAPRL
jgi:hypothetical protein